MPSSITNNPLPLALSIGEPAGIGPEIILKSWTERQAHDLPPFFVVGSVAILRKTAQQLRMDTPLSPLAAPAGAAAVFQRALPVLDLGLADEFEFAAPSRKTAALVLGAIEKSVELIFSGEAAGLVTAPIHKSALYQAGFSRPGHTEFLADLCRKATAKPEMPVMMLTSEDLRVVPLTIHIALAKVATSITPELICQTCHKIQASLQRDFAIPAPRIAVAGLNPHAGEDSAMGTEEAQIIRPALNALRADGMDISGPLPADTLFHAAARRHYDAALCMYHDQALIPLKTLDFDGGVNVTIGLPIVRTSPDHGTALNIAGENRARPDSMINALKQAQQIYQNRQNWARTHV